MEICLVTQAPGELLPANNAVKMKSYKVNCTQMNYPEWTIKSIVVCNISI